MLAKLYTACLIGLDSKTVEVEVDYRKGQTHFSVVGLADKSIQEAKDRIPPALKNSGFNFIPVKIIINLAPAELQKSGPSYDLPLALGYLLASDQIEFDPKDKMFIGELSLDGSLKPVAGILPIVDGALKAGYKEIYLPFENSKEAALVKGIDVYGIENLKQLTEHLTGEASLNKIEINNFVSTSETKEFIDKFDMAHVRGQESAKRALEIAAAGGHNILLVGVPGSGKTMLSRAIPTILPEMTFEEKLEVTRIYSIAGLTSIETPLIHERPFRSPHHTSSYISLVGGGAKIRPGEITLAHRGVLFLDEFTEFPNQSIEALRQPLEDNLIRISRASGSINFPANFMLVAAMNPCKCGYKGDQDKECKCTNSELIKYQNKISGPILDRFDLMVSVNKVQNNKLLDDKNSLKSEDIRKNVEACRQIQLSRFKQDKIFSNSEMSQVELKKYISLDPEIKELMKNFLDKMNISARSYFRILKVARTIADLNKRAEIGVEEITEALSYRIELGG